MASKPITEHIFQKNLKEKIGNVKSEEWRFTAAFRARCCLCNLHKWTGLRRGL